MKKSELRQLIREVLKEELEARNTIAEGAMNGGQAEGGFRDTAARPGGYTSKLNHNVLAGKKTKTVKAKDLKPGMITNTGKITKVTDIGWVRGRQSVEVSYGGIGNQGSSASDVVSSDTNYEVLDEAFKEEDLLEGIFDSKADKQKKYNQIIANAFDKKAPASIAVQISSLAESAIGETIDSFDETNVSTTKIAVKNFIAAIEAVKVSAKKTPYGLLTSVISYVQKYNRNATELDELIEFKRTALHTQSHEKDGQKAMYYLMEIVNKQLVSRLDRTIARLKKEYYI